MADQCYFNGDFYQCLTATEAGQSPTTDPEKWVKVTLLGKWRWALAQLTYANLLRLDGQTDKAAVERSLAYGRERAGVDDLVRQEAAEEQFITARRGRMARVNTGRTRPVKASVILDDAYRLIGWDTDQLDDREKADARMALSQAVQEMWEAWWWQELMVCERSRFATPFDQTIADGDGYPFETTVYWPAEDWYYSVAGQDVSTNPATSAGVTNNSWHKYVERIEASAYSSTQTYNFQDVVTYAGRTFAAITNDFSDEAPPVEGGRTSYWGEVGTWRPTLPYYDDASEAYIGPFGPIRSVSKYDPRTAMNPNFYEVDLTPDGTRVLNLDVGMPWVWSRRVTPVLTADDYDPDVDYEATPLQDLVFDYTASTGVYSGSGGIFATP